MNLIVSIGREYTAEERARALTLHSLLINTSFSSFSGAIDGIKFYVEPDLSRLGDIKVWEGAAVQIFFSLSVAGGGLITLSSYNEFKNNVLR